MCVYIYLFNRYVCVCMYVYIYIYIYIYIHIANIITDKPDLSNAEESTVASRGTVRHDLG